MARIQVLPLPSKTGGEYTDFALVIDQVDTDEVRSGAGAVRTNLDAIVDIDSVKQQTGAVGVLVTSDTLDVV